SALEPVPVPELLEDKKVHRAVRAISLPVCAQCRPRARRMLHALAVAAEITGLKVIAPDDTAPAKAVLTMCAGERRYPLLMSEADEEVPDLGTVKYPWQRVTATKAGPTHELELELAYDWGHRGRRYRWGDRERWKLEDKLPELLHEITQRIGIEKEREADEKRRQTERRGRWEAAMAEARRRLMEDHRAACLREQARLRSEATSMRAYCDALENRIMRAESVPGEVGEGAKAARAWVDWARSYADKLDPLTGLPGMPEHPDPTPEELRPYLHGWSPYGFDQR
ncbi:hypothetical protein AB0I10_41155, partial [Streptomyces sp. NPDC050636]